jgi:glycosyltransferase involved in cell wall biosynthesis
MNQQPSALNLPLVSVIIPAYNAEQFIERTLDSVLSQTYQNLEVIVVDDGSQDRTAEIVSAIAQRDQRVTLLQQSNSGVAAARNLGIEKSQGEFIGPIDADDIWYSQNVEKQVRCLLQADPSVGLVYSWSVDIDENDNLTGEFRASRIAGEVFTTLLFHDFIANASSALIRRSCLEKVGLYNCNLREQKAQGSEDWDLYLRIAEFYKFQVVPEFLVGYRKLPNSMSGDYISMANSRNLVWESIQQKYPRIPTTIKRLSNSSYYIYLAYQSSNCGKHSNTLLWLYKSLKEDFITPFLRLGFYVLVIKSCLNLLAKTITSLIWSDHNSWLQFQQRFKKKKRVLILEELDNQKAIFNFKPLAEKILHQLASKIFGSAENWRVLSLTA